MLDLSRGGQDEGTVPTMADLINAKIDEALVAEGASALPREYVGGSQLGEPCTRALAYTYDEARDAGWKMRQQIAAGQKPANPHFRFPGRVLRIFRDGHRIEDQCIADLRAAGFVVLDRDEATGRQFRFEVARGADGQPRMSGGLDGVVVQSPWPTIKVPCLLEIKSMNAKKFALTKDKGVQEVHPKYYAQMQVYMAYMSLWQNPAMFFFYNKDTSEYWTEFVPFDMEAAQKASDTGVRVLEASSPEEFPRISDNPDVPPCRWCDHKARCFRPTPDNSLQPASIPRPDWLG